MKKTLLIIGYVWVEPNSSAAGKRMLQLIDQFLERNYKITFACPAQKNEKAIDLISLGINEVSIELNNTSFDDFVKELNPTIVLFDRFMMEEQFGWRVAENCPKAIRILDTEDLHFLRKTRHQQLKNGEGLLFKTTMTVDDLGKLNVYEYIYFLSKHAEQHIQQMEENKFNFSEEEKGVFSQGNQQCRQYLLHELGD